MHPVPPNPGGLGGVTWELSHGVHSILVPGWLAQYSGDHTRPGNEQGILLYSTCTAVPQKVFYFPEIVRFHEIFFITFFCIRNYCFFAERFC